MLPRLLPVCCLVAAALSASCGAAATCIPGDCAAGLECEATIGRCVAAGGLGAGAGSSADGGADGGQPPRSGDAGEVTADAGGDGGALDAAHDAGPGVCRPECHQKVCGDDGCGGSCGACSPTEQCRSGKCTCVPESDADFCKRMAAQCGAATGADNCGRYRSVRSCGTCSGRLSCGGGGKPGACGCTPQCSGRTCGDDGCGGSCGTCPQNSSCSPAGQCGCNSGFMPDPSFQTCLALKAGRNTCNGVLREGYCVGDVWVFCDGERGLQALGCGAGLCRTYAGGAAGSCTCGAPGTSLPSLDERGSCNAGWTGAPLEVLLSCWNGQTTADNCTVKTGSNAGYCSTFVTSFGWQSSCYCGPCQVDSGNQQCSALCPASRCSVTQSGAVTMCN